MRKLRRKWRLAAVVLTSLPASGLADRGEGILSLGTSGNLSFFRHPLLEYGRGGHRTGTVTFDIQSGLGVGVTDWLEVGIVARAFLPTHVKTSQTSTQGYPDGDAEYDALAFHLPLTVTARFGRGGVTSIGLTLEGGLEWACWSLTSLSAPSAGGGNFDIDPNDHWSMSYLVALEPMIEWRHFDHFAFRLGPRVMWTTTGTTHIGLNLSGTLLWGIGVF